MSVPLPLPRPAHLCDGGGHSYVGHTLLILVYGVQLEVGGAHTARRLEWEDSDVHNIAWKGNTLMGGENIVRVCVFSRDPYHSPHF